MGNIITYNRNTVTIRSYGSWLEKVVPEELMIILVSNVVNRKYMFRKYFHSFKIIVTSAMDDGYLLLQNNIIFVYLTPQSII